MPFIDLITAKSQVIQLTIGRITMVLNLSDHGKVPVSKGKTQWFPRLCAECTASVILYVLSVGT